MKATKVKAVLKQYKDARRELGKMLIKLQCVCYQGVFDSGPCPFHAALNEAHRITETLSCFGA